jgi:hypothetical protein
LNTVRRRKISSLTCSDPNTIESHAVAEEVKRSQEKDGEVTVKVVDALREPARPAESWVQRFRNWYSEEDGHLF